MIISKTLPLTYIIKTIKYELVFVVLVGGSVHFVASNYKHYLPEMPLYVPAFLGTAISILLSFKMSKSYERWWEARKVWGELLNGSRTFVIQLRAALGTEGQNACVKKLAYRQIALLYSFGEMLRGHNTESSTARLMSPEDRQQLKNCRHVPLMILQMNAEEVMQLKNEGKIDGFVYNRMDLTLNQLINAMGRAERINTTVFPATFRLFLHFSVYLFITILSIALQNVALYYELPLLVTIAAVFFLLEKSSTHIQDPFMNRPNDTPVTSIARTAEMNIRQLLREEAMPQPVEPEDFYLM